MEKRNRPDVPYLLLHGYELSGVFLALAFLYPTFSRIWGAVLGHLFHVLLDQVTNLRKRTSAYFLTYRTLHGFRREATFPDIVVRDPGVRSCKDGLCPPTQI